MAGVLLRSGSVKHFLPLGATGSPVYSAASQLRAAIRRHLGTEMADYFAIPQQDEKGETIDWYSAFDGNVIPWSAATPEERSLAKGGLLAAQRQLRERSRTLQASEDSEQQVFGKLLELATRIPSDEHVYLVDGRPVMTFWGFAERDGPTDLDVLAGLDTSSVAGSTDTALLGAERAAGASVRGRWWSWPWLLLPLLLLLLLLALLAWGLRGCLPDGVPRIDVTWPAPVEPVDERTSDRPDKGPASLPDEKDDQSGLIKDKPSGDTTREVDERPGRGRTDYDATYRGSGDTRIDRRYEGSGDTRVDVDRSDADTERDDMAVDRSSTTDTSDTGVSDTTDDTRVNESDARDATADADKADGADGKDGNGDGRDDGKDTGTKEEAGKDTETDGKSKGQEDGKNSGERSKDTESQRTTRATRDSGAPLEIPRDAARKGSTDFLNGGWRSVTGLQDAAGNPVQLEYDFKGGEGTAKLRRTVNGQEQTCSAAVRSTFQGSRLVIDQADDIRCPDGSTFQRSSVECTTNAQGRAECKGKNRDGSDFQVRISKK